MSEPWELTWRDYYEILDVSPGGSDAEVNAAFRRRARTLHPDHMMNASAEDRLGAEGRFKLLSEAYDVLRDARRREAYDRARREGHAARTVVTVQPERVRNVTIGGGFVVRAIASIEGAPPTELPLEVVCNDPGVELRRIALRPARGAGATFSVRTAGRVVSGPSRTIELRYAVGGSTAVQSVEVWLPMRLVAVSSHTLSVWARSQYAGYIFVAAFFATVVFGSLGAPTWLQTTVFAVVVAGIVMIAFRSVAMARQRAGSPFRRLAVVAIAIIVVSSLLRALAGR